RAGGAELQLPFVVRAHARELQRAVVPEHARTLLADARIEERRVDAVGVHVGEPRARIPVPLADAIVGEPRRTKPQVAGARGGHEPDRPETGAVVERPDLAVVRVEAAWRPRAERLRHARLPDVRRLVDVRVGVDDRIVDARRDGEPFAHGATFYR